MPTPPPNSEPGPSDRRQMSAGKQEDADRQIGQLRYKEPFRPSLWDKSFDGLRKTISQKRARFVYQGLDLDLAYITDRIIALGYPSKGWEGGIRNTMDHTKEFLWRRHGTNNVKVFNLRGGFFYNPAHFDNHVVTFDMVDHHPPSLELMAPFCREAKEWLDEAPEHVIAVHCKAGKGRTGVMICAFLTYIRFYPNPRQILDYYSIVRTSNNKGVTIPSQRRYIYYYDMLRRLNLNYFPTRMRLMGIYIENPPQTTSGGSHIRIKVANGSTVVFSPAPLCLNRQQLEDETAKWRNKARADGLEQFANSEEYQKARFTGAHKYKPQDLVSPRAFCFMVPTTKDVFVEGDVRVDLLEEQTHLLRKNTTKKIGHVWFNTMFTTKQVPPSEDDLRQRGQKAIDQEDRAFVYGDITNRYKPEETSIARKTLGATETELFDTKESTENTKSREDGLKIVAPPGLNDHTRETSLKNIYDDYGIVPPRHQISHLLHKAHDLKIVRDEYNDRFDQEWEEQGGATSQVELADEMRLEGVNGPMRIKYNHGEHVLQFPVYEMDRALKDKKLNNRMKLFVVLRSIDQKNCEMLQTSEIFCNNLFINDENRAVHTMRSKVQPHYRPKSPDFRATGAQASFPPAVRYGLAGNYHGEPHSGLNDHLYCNETFPNSHRWCRYYYRQRSTSPSRYPTRKPVCPETGSFFRYPRDEDTHRDDRGQGGGSSIIPGEAGPLTEGSQPTKAENLDSDGPSEPLIVENRTEMKLTDEQVEKKKEMDVYYQQMKHDNLHQRLAMETDFDEKELEDGDFEAHSLEIGFCDFPFADGAQRADYFRRLHGSEEPGKMFMFPMDLAVKLVKKVARELEDFDVNSGRKTELKQWLNGCSQRAPAHETELWKQWAGRRNDSGIEKLAEQIDKKLKLEEWRSKEKLKLNTYRAKSGGFKNLLKTLRSSPGTIVEQEPEMTSQVVQQVAGPSN